MPRVTKCCRSDGYGGTTNQTVNVDIVPGEGYNRPSAQWLAGHEVPNFAGVPHCNYAVEGTDDLTPPVLWRALQTNTALPNGSVRFTNSPSGNTGFYRTRLIQ
ncbi:MAG TPA: hypothetical protein VK327_13385 [Candidatus Paceibacterota bacterium]|nr:hypothetical protein [Candidatus Paceibacterota bacterium]